ncbi:SMI1/KNR4 family protein [Paenibacillus tuaregi]|uniref:SMI1/KNR4 family protein n=1 Tax=Paenibacillus tuaregi TaxID=1816681 RepID=UPI0008396A0B
MDHEIKLLLEGLDQRRKSDGSLEVQVDETVYLAPFEFSDPASEHQIKTFKEKHQVKLPSEYRSFLKIHNGKVI